MVHNDSNDTMKSPTAPATTPTKKSSSQQQQQQQDNSLLSHYATIRMLDLERRAKREAQSAKRTISRPHGPDLDLNSKTFVLRPLSSSSNGASSPPLWFKSLFAPQANAAGGFDAPQAAIPAVVARPVTPEGKRLRESDEEEPSRTRRSMVLETPLLHLNLHHQQQRSNPLKRRKTMLRYAESAAANNNKNGGSSSSFLFSPSSLRQALCASAAKNTCDAAADNSNNNNTNKNEEDVAMDLEPFFDEVAAFPALSPRDDGDNKSSSS